jgi:hypothetical protein
LPLAEGKNQNPDFACKVARQNAVSKNPKEVQEQEIDTLK